MARSDVARRRVPPPHRNVPAETLLLSPYTVCDFGGLDSGRFHAAPEAASMWRLLSCVNGSAWRNSAKRGSPAAWESAKRPFQLPTIYSTRRHEPGDWQWWWVCVSQGGTCYSVFGEGEWIESRGSGWKTGKEGWKRSVPNRGVTCEQVRTDVRTGAKCFREDAENKQSEWEDLWKHFHLWS